MKTVLYSMLLGLALAVACAAVIIGISALVELNFRHPIVGRIAGGVIGAAVLTGFGYMILLNLREEFKK